VDLMRYAALNQGADDLANRAGFVPVGFPLPDPNNDLLRSSEEQPYALALYVHSLQPLPNPNKFDAHDDCFLLWRFGAAEFQAGPSARV
jgi:hypothetical protein